MKKVILYLAIIFGVVALDAMSKGVFLYLITGGIPVSGHFLDVVPVSYMMAHVTNFFNVVFTWNPGASFSLFSGLGESAPIAIIGITGLIIGALCYYLFARAASREGVALSLIIGGALGNLIDRIRFGAVVDFLDFHIGGYHWPAFNFADICICVGVGLYLLNLLIARRRCIRAHNLKDGK